MKTHSHENLNNYEPIDDVITDEKESFNELKNRIPNTENYTAGNIIGGNIETVYIETVHHVIININIYPTNNTNQ